MYVGATRIDFEVVDSMTLKDKRQVVRSLLDRIRVKFHLSAAEVDRLDDRRLATIAIACVGNEHGFVETVLDRVVTFVESDPRVIVIVHESEVWSQ